MKTSMKFSFALFLPVLFAACSDDPTTPPRVSEIRLSESAVELDRGALATVQITVSPADAAVEPESFTLTDLQGAAPAHVRLVSVSECSEGVFELQLRDPRAANSTGGKYTEELQVACAGAKAAPVPLTVRSTPYIPIVYVTTGVAQSSITKETWVDGKISIDGGNKFEDLAEMATEVKGRGNTTWGWAKKPYALKLNKKKEVFGMPEHKRWCLIANYMDRTHLRNRIAYHIAAETSLAYNVRSEYAELYFNGTYQGLYLLTEQIKVDENRVNVTEMEPTDNAGDAVTGGYLLEFDTNYDEDKKFRSASTNIPVNIKYPDPEDLSDEQFAYIRDYVNRVDAAIAAVGSGSSTTDPFDLLDRQSMIDFWIVFEVMANHEPLHPKSIYFHKDRGGKLVAGPVWDFDYETLVAHTKTLWINYGLSYQYNEFPWYEQNWWNLLLKNDPTFKAAVKQRWQALYSALASVPAFVEQERAAIAPAVARDNVRWPSLDTGHPNRDEDLAFPAAVDLLKSVYNERLEWMNNEISQW